MSGQNRQLFDRPALLPVLLVSVAAIYLLRQGIVAPAFLSELAVTGPDDSMRLQVVRDLLAGQGWYDIRQYRVLPPDGISLHWSRLVDAPMAALLSAMSGVVGMAQAERMLALIWPMLLFMGFAWVTMRTARTGFGVPAAAMSLIAMWFLQSLHQRYFPIGRLDHHNVQLLLMLGVFGLLLSARWQLAALAGILSALAMAVGMESLPFLGLAGLVRVWRYLRGAAEAEAALAGYGLGLGLAAPLFFAMQTDPADWGRSYCDQLSLPYLGLTTGAAGLGLAVLLTRGRLGSVGARGLLLAAVLAILAWLVLPGLLACRGGPFSDVAPEVREQVIALIAESTPAIRIFRQVPEVALAFLAPLLLITGLAAGIWLRQDRTYAERQPWGLLVLFLGLGCAGAFLQLRAMIWGHAVMAVGFGAVMAHLINRPWPMPRAVKAAVMTVIFAVIFLPQLVPIGYRMASAALQGGGPPMPVAGPTHVDMACNNGPVLRGLARLPAARIAVPLNLGVGVLVHSPHAVTAAPYHRDTQAMLNGVLPFAGDAEALRRMVTETGASLVLVCAGQVYGTPGAIGSQLAAGQAPDWLIPVPEIAAPLVLYRVDLPVGA